MIEPLRRSLHVPLPPALAFDLFVRRLPEWWPIATRSVWLDKAQGCAVDPRPGGRIIETGPNGEIEHWGTFIELEEPSRVILDWHPGHAPDHSTEVEVRFETAPLGTQVHLEHRHWERLGERGDFVRSLYANGWSPVLERFRTLALDRTDLPAATGPGCIGAEPPPGWVPDPQLN